MRFIISDVLEFDMAKTYPMRFGIAFWYWYYRPYDVPSNLPLEGSKTLFFNHSKLTLNARTKQSPDEPEESKNKVPVS